MGLFADVRWVDGAWVDGQVAGNNVLTLSIHDSDIATVEFTSSDGVAGLFYLGTEPAEYFEDPSASAPVDHDREAAAFAKWALNATNAEVSAATIRELMAVPGSDEAIDIFVEDTVTRLLASIGLELPEIP